MEERQTDRQIGRQMHTHTHTNKRQQHQERTTKCDSFLHQTVSGLDNARLGRRLQVYYTKKQTKQKLTSTRKYTVLCLFHHVYLLKHDDRWEVEQAGENVEASSMRHAHHNVLQAICESEATDQPTSDQQGIVSH